MIDWLWNHATISVDFGNLSVGVATVLIAIATFRSISNQSKLNERLGREKLLVDKMDAVNEFMNCFYDVHLPISVQAFVTKSVPTSLPSEGLLKLIKAQARLMFLFNHEVEVEFKIVDISNSLCQVTGELNSEKPMEFIKVCQSYFDMERKKIWN